MLSRTRHRLVSRGLVHLYLEHLQPVPAEVTPLYDVLPSEMDGVKAAYEFQKQHVQEVIDTDPIACWKVVAPTSEVMRPFRAVDGVCCPLFSSTVVSGVQTQRVSLRPIKAFHVEFGLLLTIGRSDGALRAVAPAIELVGSRWPYCAPHLPGYVADMCGHCKLVVGEAKPTQTVPTTGAVLSTFNDPQQVGYAKDAIGDQLNFKRLITLCDKHMPPSEAALEVIRILTPPWGGRVPVKAGAHFEANFGPVGKVAVDLE